jgi:hypothetical protein
MVYDICTTHDILYMVHDTYMLHADSAIDIFKFLSDGVEEGDWSVLCTLCVMGSYSTVCSQGSTEWKADSFIAVPSPT